MNKKFIILIFILGLALPLFYVSASSVLSAHKYAWSNNVGYINFESVIVNDNALSGYAWSVNKGLIKFNPAQGGVLNDGSGNLSGSAWGEQLGWIDFDNVSINPTTGKFSGTATGTLVGIITFDCPNYCDVETDWRQPISISGSSKKSEGGFLVAPNEVLNEIPSVTASTQPVPGVNNNIGSVPLLFAQTPALFDVISEPIQPNQKSAIPFVALSIIAETLALLLILYSARRVKIYMAKRLKTKEINISKNTISDKNNENGN